MELLIWGGGSVKYLPVRPAIEDTGWKRFLNTWNRERLDLLRSELLWENRTALVSEADILKAEKVFGLEYPRDIIAGGLHYPPRNEKELARVESRLGMFQEYAQAVYEDMRKHWAQRLVSYTDHDEILRNSTLSRPPATEDRIRRAEERLGVTLPPSYKAFLRESNGWVMGDIYLNWVDHIDYLKNTKWNEWLVEEAGDLYPDGRVSDERYFNYGSDQDPIADMRPEYLPGALMISEELMDPLGFVLLNPAVVDENGEWEAWLTVGLHEGVQRFRSFGELMELLYMREIAFARRRCDQIGANWHFE